MKHADLMASMGFQEPERTPLTNVKPLLNITKASQVDMKPYTTHTVKTGYVSGNIDDSEAKAILDKLNEDVLNEISETKKSNKKNKNHGHKVASV